MTKKVVRIGRYLVNPDRLFLRTSRDGISRGGFKRKPVGQWNDAGDKWTGIPDCDKCGGFFGVDREANGFVLFPRSTLELCEWRGERVVIEGNKICVSSYRVVATNENIPAEYIRDIVRVLEDGETLKEGLAVSFGGNITLLDGCLFAFNGTVVDQRGGECCAYAGSNVNVFKGLCRAYAHSVVRWRSLDARIYQMHRTANIVNMIGDPNLTGPFEEKWIKKAKEAGADNSIINWFNRKQRTWEELREKQSEWLAWAMIKIKDFPVDLSCLKPYSRMKVMVDRQDSPIDLSGLNTYHKACVMVARKDCPIDLTGFDEYHKTWVMISRKDCPIDLTGLSLYYKAWIMTERKDCPIDFTGLSEKEIVRIKKRRPDWEKWIVIV